VFSAGQGSTFIADQCLFIAGRFLSTKKREVHTLAIQALAPGE
jgi:hypothetical protein